MRRTLDRLYDGCAALAAIFMVALLVMVLLSIASRELGFNVPGIDIYAGYMMAAAGFLAMAHTLKKGEHIRVTLLLGALRGGARRGLEIWALFAAMLLAMLSAFYSAKLAWQSYAFHDISTGNQAFTVQNTIVALNVVRFTGTGPDVSGPFSSLGHDLIGDSTGGTGFIDGSNGDIVGSSVNSIDPKLGQLQNNGGPTKTMALQSGSPAIDHGDNGIALTTDQRRLPREKDGNFDGVAVVDIGAFER